jgi:hypothetical protein
VYTDGVRFILVQAECLYFQSLVTCATNTIDNQTRSRVTSSRKREERLLDLLSGWKWTLEAARWSPS